MRNIVVDVVVVIIITIIPSRSICHQIIRYTAIIYLTRKIRINNQVTSDQNTVTNFKLTRRKLRLSSLLYSSPLGGKHLAALQKLESNRELLKL